VTGFSLSEDAASANRARWLQEMSVAAIEGDIRDARAVLAAVETTRPNVVVHLAAQALLGRGFLEPTLTFDVNINGSLNVLEAVRRLDVPALVHVTSDKCYSPRALTRGPVAEDGPLGGTGPYPASKTIAEILFAEFSRLVPEEASSTWMGSVRLGNVVGGGDEADRLVPNCLRAFRDHRAFAVRDPDAVRPWQHVGDVAAGLSLLAQALLRRGVPNGLVLNFAPPRCDVTVGDLVHQLAAAWGAGAQVSDKLSDCPFPEETLLRLDGSYATELLGWRHRVASSALAEATVEWERLVSRGMSPAEATWTQAGRLSPTLPAVSA
jgi:CDP-glucose 4,6-dehydratase